MEQMLFLIFISWGLFWVKGLSSAVVLFVNQSKTFDEALRICRDEYIDLVSLWDQSDMDALFTLKDFTFTETAWIGLRKSRREQWLWSLSDPRLYKAGETEYTNWGPREPTNTAGEFCSVMDSLGNIRDTPCLTPRSFICYNDQGSSSDKYVFVSSPKAWRDAQSHCRSFYTDLVSVRNLQENQQIQSLVPAGGVSYIGYFKDDFAWSDSSTSSYRNWDHGQPDGSGICAVLQFHNHMWNDLTCTDPRGFFCSADAVLTQTVRLQLKALRVEDLQLSLLQQIRQTLVSGGLSEYADVQWRKQQDGNIFQRTEDLKTDAQNTGKQSNTVCGDGGQH
ncbi:macrophage mannose receptor 1 [Danio rerio]|uniref:Macrophage mannose receptor 1 n=1 Tax=Danio rerio TaxID=7955 RepID=A0A8M9Q356_DANRE